MEKHNELRVAHDLHRLLFSPSNPRVDFTLLDLAQKTMDGFKDSVGGAPTYGSKANSAALMMQDMAAEQYAMLWALVRSITPSDRHFVLLHNLLTSEIRLKFQEDGFKTKQITTKEAAKGVARSALIQFLFKRGLCTKCNGKGFVYSKLELKHIDCSKCEGKKENAYNQSERYRLSNLTIDRKAYIRTYEQYEKFAIDVLGKWRIDLDSHLRGFFRHASEEYDL
ncbi:MULTISPECIES: hypothetical protein [Acinetobacter calcoaceticus/baumannii complex]|uniref:hypothetical protein n=1 Tax=Acinetobacter calcoaceticus/baumannii complex TaxID=909768 RepID=UPI001DBD5287|nr:hypothetical protein [Acinetobacter baumannii]EHU2377085.1 hypothetical protein [Acinetobacter baumannii]EHU2752647.1 hypothetical protein [Acinetobacter baumannii]MCW8690045.1 hypothetical protein [Acinetobacter baumannii]MCW8769023.1 hypothetical protein [Acinetobacter baumannii]MCZ3354926.1 hypothetical protein [Acinetobacter baumannii]